MQAIDPRKNVGELVVERPDLIPLFERLGIDYCCGGRLSLEEACARKGLDAASVAQTIDAFESLQDGEQTAEPDWAKESLTALCDHIEQTHHRYLAQELPELGARVAKVARVHGGSDPGLHQVKAIFDDLAQELLDHLRKEEKLLFPLIRRLDNKEKLPPGVSVAAPIRQMESEHAASGDALAALRDLTRGFTAPPGACGTYRAMLAGLERLERDLHLHIHKENNILFPRAIARELAL